MSSYSTASTIHLGASQRQQDYFIRIIFRLKRTDKVRTYQKILHLSIFEFHIYELFKLYRKIVGREHNSLLVNNLKSTANFERCLYVKRRSKSLTTKYKMTTANKNGQKHEHRYCSTQSIICTDWFGEIL